MEKPRQKRSGCVIALMIFAGLAAVAVVVAAIVIYLFLQTEEGKRFYASFTDSAALTLKATRGPAVLALQGVGCETPMVLTVGEWTRLESSFATLAHEESETQVADDVADVPLVQCYGTGSIDALPACDDLALTYAKASESAPPRFIVLAFNEGDAGEEDQIVCTGYYDATGARIGELGRNFTFIPEN
ncbi:MAG: hypothetical protein R3286_11515 [Gammaproteobacteria bacterium]|nr:hypothetical protein [Gammaproteobacteria bacterium]